MKLVGGDLQVPLVTGEWVRYANLDNAASAPALESVAAAVDELLPYYGSVHRGAGFASVVSTEAYTRAREIVRGFVGAREDDVVLPVPKLFFGYARDLAALYPFGVGAAGIVFPQRATPERMFELVARHRPRSYLEIGTASGLSAAVVAHMLEEHGGERLTTVDLLDHFYADPSKEAGFLLPTAYTGPVTVERRTGWTAVDVVGAGRSRVTQGLS